MLICGYLARTEIAAQQFFHAGGVKAALGSNSRQNAWTPHIVGVNKISSKQIFYNLILQAFAAGQPNEPVGVEGVGCPLDAVEAELDAVFHAGLGHTGFELLRISEAAEFSHSIGLPVYALLRGIGIELEGFPANLRSRPAQQRQRFFQASLADETPRTDDIRDHFDNDFVFHGHTY